MSSPRLDSGPRTSAALRPRRRLRDGLLALALVAASAAFTSLALEGSFRLVGVHVGTVQINRGTVRRSPNPRLRFELRPKAIVHAEVEYRINGEGMRDVPRVREKAAGTRRVAVLGDSIAFGYWVAARDSFPAQLETLLGDAPGGAPVEVLNFGVPGYNLEQEIELLRARALGFAPDLVIFALCLNDLEGGESYEHGLVVDRGARSAALAGRAYEALLDRSLLLSWIEYRRTELAARRQFTRARDPWSGPLYAETLAEQEAALTARFHEAQAALGGTPALVAVFPAFNGPFDDRYRHADFHRLAARAAKASGLGLVDLLDCYRGYVFRDVRVDVVHPSPLGHRVAAHALADALCARGWPCPTLGRTCGEYRSEEFPQVRGY